MSLSRPLSLTLGLLSCPASHLAHLPASSIRKQMTCCRERVAGTEPPMHLPVKQLLSLTAPASGFSGQRPAQTRHHARKQPSAAGTAPSATANSDVTWASERAALSAAQALRLRLLLLPRLPHTPSWAPLTTYSKRTPFPQPRPGGPAQKRPAHTHSCSHTLTFTYMCTHEHSFTHTHIHTLSHVHTLAHSHMCAHMHAHIHTCRHIHVCTLSLDWDNPSLQHGQLPCPTQASLEEAA